MRDNVSIVTRFSFLLLATVFISMAVGGYFTYYSLQITERSVLKEDVLWEKSLAAISKELARLNDVQQEIIVQEEKILQLVSELEKNRAVEPEEKEEATISLRLLPGDNIWNLVARFVDSPSAELISEILEINNIADPKKISSGSRITLPLRKVSGK